MSRRIKLLITSLFLVLLAMLATHLVLTWSPTQPLVFRVVEQHIDPVAGPPNRVVVLEMENRSRASLYLATGYLISGVGEKGTSDIEDAYQRGVYHPEVESHDPETFALLGGFQWAFSRTHPHAPAGEPRPRLILPGEIVRVEVQVSEKGLAVGRMDDVYVFYGWVTTTRWAFHRFQHRLYVIAGKKIAFEEPFLELLKDSMTPLPMPPTVLPAPGKP